LDELQAAFLREKLRHLDEWNEQRRSIASQYEKLLQDTNIGLPFVHADTIPVWHLYVIRHRERDALQQHLLHLGIETLIHYPIPAHKQTAYRESTFVDQMLLTQQIADSILSLPIYPGLDAEKIEAISRALHNYIG